VYKTCWRWPVAVIAFVQVLPEPFPHLLEFPTGAMRKELLKRDADSLTKRTLHSSILLGELVVEKWKSNSPRELFHVEHWVQG